MLLTITLTRPPATDLGYLLHKHPDRCQTFSLNFGAAHVFYPEVTGDRCTAALLLDVDPVGLARGRKAGDNRPLEAYVNDRPYVASSFLSVAISQVFRSAMTGSSKERPEAADELLPLRAMLSVVPCRGGEILLRRLFEPLGYVVEVEGRPLDETFPDWGESPYYTVRLSGIVRLRDLLTHLYVLVPVMDNEKHYWVGEDEVEKLLRHGADWLPSHPEKSLIAMRYLKHKRSLAEDALARLVDEPDPDGAEREHGEEEEAVERRLSLNEQRLGTVLAVVKESGAKRVLDLGCGEGRLLGSLLKDPAFERIAGMDVSHRALETAADRLRLNRLPPKQRERISLFQGSLIYRDPRLEEYDAATVVEVIEHLDPPRLAAFERVMFEFARPRTVVLTTPNAEYNVMWETLPAGKFRHRDHRFEWTREQFQTWAKTVAERFGYAVRFVPVGPVDEAVGSPTQLGVFNKNG